MTTICNVVSHGETTTQEIVNQRDYGQKITNAQRRRVPLLPSCHFPKNKITTIYLNVILLFMHHIITLSSATFIMTHPSSPPVPIIITYPTSLSLSFSPSPSSSPLNNNNASPLLVLITLPDTLTTSQNITITLLTLTQAFSSSPTLLSIRCPHDPFHLRSSFVKCVVELKNQINPSILVVVNDDVEAAMEGGADGVHLKEMDAGELGNVRRMWRERFGKRCMVGTSVHSVEGTLDICRRRRCDRESDRDNNVTDYLFFGTCYTTLSLPKKKSDDLEVPCLPGDVKRALIAVTNESPSVFAIGGINETSCWEPVRRYGADGVAVIQGVMEADDPKGIVTLLKRRMLGEGGDDEERDVVI